MFADLIRAMLPGALRALGAATALLFGCAAPEVDQSAAGSSVAELDRVVVTEFQAALQPGEGPDFVREPLTGAVFAAEPVSEDAARFMTELLVDEISGSRRVEVVSPGQARGVYSGILRRDVDFKLRPLEILQEIGRALGAEAVFTGAIYRWREREGTDFAAQTPASVAFDLHLIRTKDGAVLWRGQFDKSQKSLSENLFDLEVFVKGRGRWMTAEQLARFGLKKLVAQMPLARPLEDGKEGPGTEGL